MKVASERPLLLYCEGCGDLGRFRGGDDHEIALKLSGSGWHVRPRQDGGLSVTCPQCYVEDLRTRAHVQAGREIAGPEQAPLELVRTYRMEIVNEQGKPVLTARAGSQGGKLTLLGNDGARVIVVSAAQKGGILGVADHGGNVLWRAPCRGNGCGSNGH